MDTHQTNYLNTQEGRKLPIPHCIQDTAGWTLYGEVLMSKAGRPSTSFITRKPPGGSCPTACCGWPSTTE